MKVSLTHLKELVRHFKEKECPKLSAGKVALHKFADAHGLLGDYHKEPEMKHEAVEKVEKHMELAKEAKAPAVKEKHIKMAMKEAKKAEVVEKKPVKITKEVKIDVFENEEYPKWRKGEINYKTDIVEHKGKVYVATDYNLDEPPSNNWKLMIPKKSSAPAPAMSKKEAHSAMLKKVMEIRKTGKSLKEAWAEVKK